MGTLLNRRLPASRLKPAFGWFVLAVGITILVQELLVAVALAGPWLGLCVR